MMRWQVALRELIGRRRLRAGLRSPWVSFPLTGSTRDDGRADYAFWDGARRGAVRGLELGGLLLKPLGSKAAAWVLGDVPTSGEPRLDAWRAAHHAAVLRAYEEALMLGDCFLVINADLSATVVPPHVVQPIYALDEPGRIDGWRICERFDDVTVMDEYTALERRRTVQPPTGAARTTVYPNLIGRVPVVHIANRRGADELFGRPEGEALIPLLRRYNEVLDAALKGNIRQGRPTPVIERMGTAEQVARFWERFGRREQQTLPDGSTETVEVIDFDPDHLLTLGGEATFAYKAPGGFSADTEALLGLLFLLVVEHSEIPEFAWGGALESSKASAETQMPVLERWVAKKRGMAQEWLDEVAAVVRGYVGVMS